jgi:hypothetical protein
MAMIRKDEVTIEPANDIHAQRDFVTKMFGVAA